jgi:hypothetical protein
MWSIAVQLPGALDISLADRCGHHRRAAVEPLRQPPPHCRDVDGREDRAALLVPRVPLVDPRLRRVRYGILPMLAANSS